MENVYDIRKNEKLLYILPKEGQGIYVDSVLTDAVAVVVNLYYPDLVSWYMEYLNKVPKEIDVYVISSNAVVSEEVKKHQRRDMFFLGKENRGRDVSALLVAFRKYVKRYEYICFLHDKKANYSGSEKDARLWNYNLWENTISSPGYIGEVLQLFLEKPDLGLLVPPEPFGEYYVAWAGNGWAQNFRNTVELAEKLSLNCAFDEIKSPIAYGTVFWAKTDCLMKLLEYEWKYEDFSEEPLAPDGTISHAIERILPYVAQDAGGKTATIMTTSYAEELLLSVQDSMKKMQAVLSEELNIHCMHQLYTRKQREERVKSFCGKVSRIFIYGAGQYGKSMLKELLRQNIRPEGFVVSDGRRTDTQMQGYPVMEIGELGSDEQIGIIVATHYRYVKEIKSALRERGFTRVLIATEEEFGVEE